MAVRLDLPPEAIKDLVTTAHHADHLVGIVTTGELEEKFVRLRDHWKSEMVHVSSATRRVLHPSYQAIVGMGPAVLPLLFKELERSVDSWFWALHAITEEDPSSQEVQGDGEAMAKAWLDWAKRKGYEW